MEHWKPILDGDYEVSNQGRIKRIRASKGAKVGHMINLNVVRAEGGRYPYVHANLRYRGESRSFRVHSLVAAAFIGPRPAGAHINHKDGDPFNNYVENLEYVTPKENALHASS